MGSQQLLLRPSGAFVLVTNRSAANTVLGSAPATVTATATYALQSSGVLRLNGTTDIPGEWLLSGPASGYDVRFTHLSGDVPSGPGYGSWFNLGTTRSLTLTATRVTNGVTTLSGDVRVEIGAAGAGFALVTADINMFAEAERVP